MCLIIAIAYVTERCLRFCSVNCFSLLYIILAYTVVVEPQYRLLFLFCDDCMIGFGWWPTFLHEVPMRDVVCFPKRQHSVHPLRLRSLEFQDLFNLTAFVTI